MKSTLSYFVCLCLYICIFVYGFWNSYISEMKPLNFTLLENKVAGSSNSVFCINDKSVGSLLCSDIARKAPTFFFKQIAGNSNLILWIYIKTSLLPLHCSEEGYWPLSTCSFPVYCVLNSLTFKSYHWIFLALYQLNFFLILFTTPRSKLMH